MSTDLLILDDDDDIEQAIREEADTVYHPVGTCMMGKDEMAVVDNKLKVHKLDGLRVVDASIMPTLDWWKYKRTNNYDCRKSFGYNS